MNGQTDDKSREELPLKELAKQEQTVKTVQDSQEDEHEERLKIRTYYDEDLEGTATELLDAMCKYNEWMLGESISREEMLNELNQWYATTSGKKIEFTEDMSKNAKTIFEKTHMLREVNGIKVDRPKLM